MQGAFSKVKHRLASKIYMPATARKYYIIPCFSTDLPHPPPPPPMHVILPYHSKVKENKRNTPDHCEY